MERRRIATVIPPYNGRKYIHQAIESVLRQTRKSDRIVVVNDGSSDDGAEVASRDFPADSCEIIHTANGGQSSAGNIGVKGASGCHLVAFPTQRYPRPQHARLGSASCLDKQPWLPSPGLRSATRPVTTIRSGGSPCGWRVQFLRSRIHAATGMTSQGVRQCRHSRFSSGGIRDFRRWRTCCDTACWRTPRSPSIFAT